MLSKTSVCSLAIILALFYLIGTKQYGRAKVIGERTAGAGYNNIIIPLGKGYSFSVSFGRPIHPRSGKGWEGENREQLKREACRNSTTKPTPSRDTKTKRRR